MKMFRILGLFLVVLVALFSLVKAEDSCPFPALNKESWEKTISGLVDNTQTNVVKLNFADTLTNIYTSDSWSGRCPLGICGELREASDCNAGKCSGEGFDSKGKRYETHCVNGKYNGKQILYDDNKNVVMELNYVNGILDGKQKLPSILHKGEDSEDKVVISDVIIKNGKLSGKLNILRFLDEYSEYDGFNAEFRNGKAVGEIKYFVRGSDDYAPETIIAQLDNQGNVKTSIFKSYHLKDDKIYEQRELVKYKNNKMIYSRYFEGQINKDDMFFTFNITDDEIINKLKEIPEATYESKQFNEQGQKQGKWIEQGKDYAIESNYANDLLNGVKKEWKNGKLIKEETYANGELNGDVKEYNENGELTKHEIYKDNKRTKILR